MLVWTLPAMASETDGTVSPTEKYAWGENMGWINFAPTNGSNYVGVEVTDTQVKGYAWSGDYGWINFNPSSSGQGVTNTPSGQLGGYAWSASLGWVSMSGVTIDANGKFNGVAGVQSLPAGRINFNCTSCNVKTDWRPLSARSSGNSGGSSGPGGVVGNPYLGGSNGGGGIVGTQQSTQGSEIGQNAGQTQTTEPSGNPYMTPENPTVPITQHGTAEGETQLTEVVTSTQEQSTQGTQPYPKILMDFNITNINSGQPVGSNIHFVNFDNKITPVDITFAIQDTSGKSVYTDHFGLILNGVYDFNHQFGRLDLPEGDYQVTANFVYGDGQKRLLRQTFHVKPTSNYLLHFVVTTVSILIIILIFVLRLIL